MVAYEDTFSKTFMGPFQNEKRRATCAGAPLKFSYENVFIYENIQIFQFEKIK